MLTVPRLYFIVEYHNLSVVKTLPKCWKMFESPDAHIFVFGATWPETCVSVKLGSLARLVRKVSKVSMESADGQGEGSYMGTFLPTPGKIFHPVSSLCQ
jgi:hypothetical protein